MLFRKIAVTSFARSVSRIVPYARLLCTIPANVDAASSGATAKADATAKQKVEKYVGDLIDGKRHGQGTLEDAYATFVGTWSDNKRNGPGKLTTFKGFSIEGTWINDLLHGMGKTTFSNGGVAEGEWVNGKLEGVVKNVNAEGVAFESTFQDGKRHGPGELIVSSTEYYRGVWSKGRLMSGEGAYRTKDGVIRKGTWVKGRFVPEEKTAKAGEAELGTSAASS